MIPKGKLLIIGGAEYKGEDDDLTMEGSRNFRRFELLEKLLPSNGKKKIELITTGTRVPQEVRKSYQHAFRRIGYPHLGFMHITSKQEARDKKLLRRIEQAGAVFFSGGKQFRLSTILGGTAVIELIHERYKHDSEMIVAGTSAGAMAMSRIMLRAGGSNEALVKDDLQTSSGFGFLEYCIVDTHFVRRGRFGRLAHAVITNPAQLGVGLGEDTALVITKGCKAACVGSGMAVIIDGKSIEQSNVSEAEKGEVIYVENLKVHLLVRGCRFDLKARKLEKVRESTRA